MASAEEDARSDTRPYDVVISYATDDYDRAKEIAETLRTSNKLRVFFDEPKAIVRSPLESLLTATRRRFQKWTARSSSPPEPGTRSDDELRLLLEEWLRQGLCVLVLWSRSHRGSFWAGQEIDIFELHHRDRPIFCYRLDETPFEPSTAQWRLLDNPAQLTRDRASERVSWEVRAPTPPRSGLLDPLLRPNVWSRRAQRFRSGTTLPELIGMLSAASQQGPAGTERRALVRSAVASAALVSMTLFLMLIGVGLAGGHIPEKRQLMRNSVFATLAVWVACPIVATQLSVAQLLPSAVIGVMTGLATEMVVIQCSDSSLGGPAVGAAMGALFGATFGSTLVGHRFHLQTYSSEARRALRGTLTGAIIAVGLAAGISVLIAPQAGALRGGLLLFVIPLLLFLPSLVVWQELSHLGRAREILQRGVLPGVGLLGLALAIAWGFNATSTTLNQQRLPGAVVGGALTAVCFATAYVTPGAILAWRVPSIVRSASSVVVVTLTLVSFCLVFPWLRPGDQFIPDLQTGTIAYGISFAIGMALVSIWLFVTKQLQTAIYPSRVPPGVFP